MNIIGDIFKNKRLNKRKTVEYGFVKKDGKYYYSVDILNSQFRMSVSISVQGEVSANIIDNETNELYTVFLFDNASGSFVGLVRGEYQRILNDISSKCFEREVFKSGIAKQIIRYAAEKYGTFPEYLWENLPESAVLRRKDNAKWYAVLMRLSQRKLELESDRIVDIIVLHADTDEIERIVDNKSYFPGYHMNKRHWFTICLDGSVPVSKIVYLLNRSYEASKVK